MQEDSPCRNAHFTICKGILSRYRSASLKSEGFHRSMKKGGNPVDSDREQISFLNFCVVFSRQGRRHVRRVGEVVLVEVAGILQIIAAVASSERTDVGTVGAWA